MYLTHLTLNNLRNYARLEIDLQARVHMLQGENAQGKTNFLEAIYYLATTRSPLAGADRELIAWSAHCDVIPHAHIGARYVRAGDEHSLEATLVLERQPGDPLENAVFRRQIRADGAPRRAMDALGRLNVVLFLPEDIAIVSGSPGERRRYLDVTLCQVDVAYCRSLARYNRVLTQRNALLRALREGRAQGNELAYWDAQLVQYGGTVLGRRLQALQQLEAQALRYQSALTGETETLRLAYVASCNLPDLANEKNAGLVDETPFSQALTLALRHARNQELARGMTLLGPHRDDVRFFVNDIDMTTYGSRGQQRTVALALKLAEVVFMRARTGETPVLLLDDVISELDQRRSHFMLSALDDAQQVFITTTKLEDYPPDFVGRSALWRVERGALTPVG